MRSTFFCFEVLTKLPSAAPSAGENSSLTAAPSSIVTEVSEPRLAVAPQTVAEARYGELKAGWGAVAHDGVFLGCPGLDLRTEVEAGS